jgi:hypothetical protein
MEPEQREACEIAAEQSGYVEHARAAFRAGWAAAMEYTKRNQSVIGEEQQGYPSFHDDGMPLG